MGFFDRISTGWELVKRSLKVLKEDKEIADSVDSITAKIKNMCV